MDAMFTGIEQWNHRHPDRWDTVTTPGQYRMTDPTTGRPLPMGWSASFAAAASAAGRLDPDLLRASLMQNAVEHEPRPCVFFLEDNDEGVNMAGVHDLDADHLVDELLAVHVVDCKQIAIIEFIEAGEQEPVCQSTVRGDDRARALAAHGQRSAMQMARALVKYDVPEPCRIGRSTDMDGILIAPMIRRQHP